MSGLDIKLERTRLGLRQYKVAAALGWPSTTLWMIEANRRPVSPELANTITETMRQLAERDASTTRDDRAA